MLDKFDLLSHDSLTMLSSLKSISFPACRVVIQIHSPKEIKLYGQQYFTIRQTATQRENRVIRSHKRGDFALTESRACGI